MIPGAWPISEGMDATITDPDVAQMLAELREAAVPSEIVADQPEMFAAVEADARF